MPGRTAPQHSPLKQLEPTEDREISSSRCLPLSLSLLLPRGAYRGDSGTLQRPKSHASSRGTAECIRTERWKSREGEIRPALPHPCCLLHSLTSTRTIAPRRSPTQAKREFSPLKTEEQERHLVYSTRRVGERRGDKRGRGQEGSDGLRQWRASRRPWQ